LRGTTWRHVSFALGGVGEIAYFNGDASVCLIRDNSKSLIEPGKLCLNPLTGSKVIGPIPVPMQLPAICEPGCDIGGVVAKVGKGWRLVEVWNVSP
jgi:hypothetical protein